MPFDGAAMAFDFECFSALGVLALEAVHPGLVVGGRLSELGGGCGLLVQGGSSALPRGAAACNRTNPNVKQSVTVKREGR